MLKYLKYLLTTLLISICLFESVVYGIIVQKKGVFHASFQNVIVDKYRMLQETNEKKIIMVSGSSAAFGLDQRMLERETGYKIINLGVHAGFGTLFFSELAKENINEGDIVLLGYEYNWFKTFDRLGQKLIMSGIDENIDMYKHIPVNYWKNFVGYMLKYAGEKYAGEKYIALTHERAKGMYSREAFREEDAQMIWTRDYALSDYYDNVTKYGTITVVDENGNVTITDTSAAYLKKLKEFAESRGASIYFVSPPILYESVTCDVDSFLKLKELEERTIGIPYISDPRLYLFPPDLMADSVNHCNNEGEKIRTRILADDLKLCGAVESEKLSGMVKDELGETFVLVDSLPKRFLHRPETINKVYRIDAAGNETLYKNGIDYYVDYERGTIRRTDDSAIPNYREHHVAYTSGKWALVNEPGNQNPESNKEYQIRVDYRYEASQEESEPLADNSSYLSDNVRKKILNGESIRIALCGDSVGAGAETDGSGIFLNYLGRSLKDYYGVDVQTTQLPAGVTSRDLLTAGIPDIIKMHPDVAMIEFGINDHCGPDGASEERVSGYRNDIENAVDTLQKNGIDVILIGFPQQNMTWELENMEATRLYNEALKDIADRKHVYFADVYDFFEKVGNIKPISRDVMADYLHFPNEWGHKLYYTSIISAFNITGKMKPTELPDYIYVN